MRRPTWIFVLTLLLYGVGAMWWQRPQGPQDNRVQSPLWLGQWVTTWSGVPQLFQPRFMWGSIAPPPEFWDAAERGILQDQTVRVSVQSTLSGSRVRIRLSNQYGKRPLTVGAARIVRLASKDPVWMGSFRWSYWEERPGNVRGGRPVYAGSPDTRAAIADTERDILFSKQTSVVIPAGATIESDPVEIDTGYRSYMLISLYLPKLTEPATVVTAQTALVLTGNKTMLGGQEPKRGWGLRGSYWLADVEVFAGKNSKAILIIDDDGAIRDRNSEPNASWQEPFKERLLTKDGVRHFAVLNSSMSYCALTAPCSPSIFERIEDARRNRGGVKWVIVSSGYQDILTDKRPDGVPKLSADDVIRELKSVADAAHAAGMKIYGVTYPPFTRTWYGGSGLLEKEAMRVAVNRWIRESRAFDAVADFDQVLRDPADPSRLQDVFTWTQHTPDPAVLSDIAFREMAETFDLSVF